MWNQDFPTAIYENDPPPALPVRGPALVERRPGLAAAHAGLARRYRPRGRGAGYRRSLPRQRQPGQQPGAGHPQEICRSRSHRGRAATAGQSLLQHSRAGHYPGGQPQEAPPGEILLINAPKLFAKGRPKNNPADEHIEAIARLYRDWQAEEDLSAVIANDEAASNDYNLSPSRFVASNDKEEVLPLEEAVVLLKEAEEERAEADRALQAVLKSLKLDG